MTDVYSGRIRMESFIFGSISTPILDTYFKRVHVGIFMKDEIDKAMKKLGGLNE